MTGAASGDPLDRSIARLRDELGAVRHSPWILIDQAMIDSFAAVTGDHEFIHVDRERARQSPMGGTIAHGLLTLSLLPRLLEGAGGRPQIDDAEVTLNYGFDRIRFVSPVRSGKRVRLRVALAGVQRRDGDRVQTELDCSVEIEDEDKPALVARWLMQTGVRAAGAQKESDT